jgi:hypothetical protein
MSTDSPSRRWETRSSDSRSSSSRSLSSTQSLSCSATCDIGCFSGMTMPRRAL